MKHKIDSVQILRAFAALAVVQFHTDFRIGSWHTFGAFGVDIFFVISGFIMAMICTAGTENFLGKRLIRIVPLYWSLTLLTFLFLVTHPAFDSDVRRGGTELLKSLLFIPYTRNDGSIFPILVVGWTLNYELCFYLVLSVAIYFYSRRWLIPATMLSLSALLLAARLLPAGVLSLFYGNLIMLEFMAGLCAYWVYTRLSQERCVQLRPLFYAAIPLCAIFMAWYEATRFYLPHSTRAGLGVPAFFLMLSVVLLSKSGIDSRSRLLILLGDSSYALYLTHTFVISAFKHIIGSHLPFLQPAKLPGMIAAIALSCAVAIAIHLLLDQPTYRYLGRLLLPRRLALLQPGQGLIQRSTNLPFDSWSRLKSSVKIHRRVH